MKHHPGTSVLGAAFFPLFTKAAAAAAAKETAAAAGDLGPEGIKIHRLDGHQWGILNFIHGSWGSMFMEDSGVSWEDNGCFSSK